MKHISKSPEGQRRNPKRKYIEMKENEDTYMGMVRRQSFKRNIQLYNTLKKKQQG
jgi:hypothetical protein